MIDSTRLAIYVIDKDGGDTLIYTAPTGEGAFALSLKQGIYELHFLGTGYEELIRPLQIISESNKEGITLADNVVLPLVKEEAELTEEAKLFEGDASPIKLKVTQVEEEGDINRNRTVVDDSEAEDMASQESLEQMPDDEQPIIQDELVIEDPDLLLDESTKSKAAWPLLVLLVVAGVGLVGFVIIWWRRREKRKKQWN